ncbi:MAG: polysaccharide lyase family 7 protein [Gammaproteobacteria bacterium]|nr:polysaccharide lyase family 7 protein [Gammaproteobacteria bacterium]NNL51197.1 cyclic nucleotide-binding protein [Woeseiaceae bacterium]
MIAATDNGLSNAGNGPDMAIDDNLDPASRWESPGDPMTITFDLGARYLVREVGIAWFQGDQRVASFSVFASEDGVTFESLLADQQSSGETMSFERYDVPDTPAQYIRIEGNGNSLNPDNAIIEGTAFGCTLDTATAVFENGNVVATDFALNPALPPGSNFELISWKLNTPADLDGNGLSDTASETDLDNGFTDEFFFTGPAGGMVYRSTIGGAKTSANTSYTRSELREMLRRGNTSISTRGANQNNWILGYQPDPRRTVGGRNGVLRGTLAVNHVTETGDRNQVGRVIIGQIHAESDEPLRLYYRKYPENERGFVYFAHEIRNSDDIYFPVLGPVNSNLDNAPSDDANPANGIALNEIFSYEITQQDARIDVIVRRGDGTGPIIGHNYVDMRQQSSGYDDPDADEWMYFKAGAYTQNNTGDETDFDQVTFYELENSHDL